MQITVIFDWNDVGVVSLTEAGQVGIPRVAARPGVYRFQVTGAARVEVYVGECENLRHRMSSYAGTHTGTPRVQIRERLWTHLAAGQEVRLAVVEGASLNVNGVLGIGRLEQRDVRLLVESAALLAARQADEYVHDITG